MSCLPNDLPDQAPRRACLVEATRMPQRREVDHTTPSLTVNGQRLLPQAVGQNRPTKSNHKQPIVDCLNSRQGGCEDASPSMSPVITKQPVSRQGLHITAKADGL